MAGLLDACAKPNTTMRVTTIVSSSGCYSLNTGHRSAFRVTVSSLTRAERTSIAYHAVSPLYIVGVLPCWRTTMLKRISPLLSPELLYTIAQMGHGDELVLADANFPAAAIGKRLVRADGHGVPTILKAVLELFPLDEFVPK